MTPEQDRVDKINQLRQRLAEANRYANHANDLHMRALANVVRIREKLEDLLLEGNSDAEGWKEYYSRQRTMKESIDE